MSEKVLVDQELLAMATMHIEQTQVYFEALHEIITAKVNSDDARKLQKIALIAWEKGKDIKVLSQGKFE